MKKMKCLFFKINNKTIITTHFILKSINMVQVVNIKNGSQCNDSMGMEIKSEEYYKTTFCPAIFVIIQNGTMFNKQDLLDLP